MKRNRKMEQTMENLQTAEGTKAVAGPLLEWYRKNRRDLPWRHTTDPYKIWLSEIMLQQTRVDTVIQYYRRFLERFGTLRELAEAPVQDVLIVWKGLGYYSRALNLQKAARQVVEQCDGVFPRDYEAIRQLPGIGDYTAGAIAGIAFNQPYPAVDGNVLRVICRLEGIKDDISQERTKKRVAAVVDPIIPKDHAREFTQALMELGALVCIPLAPLCGQCPVQSFCTAYRTGRQDELPVKKKKEAPRGVPCWVAVLRENGKILLEYRKNDRLLGQLWGLPIAEKKGSHPSTQLLEEKYGLRLKNARKLGSASHVFTHQVWKMDVFTFTLAEPMPSSDVLHWVEETELERYAIPTAFQRVLKLLHSDNGWEQLELPMDE
jgi:A/G-specific adenine glycosylase